MQRILVTTAKRVQSILSPPPPLERNARTDTGRSVPSYMKALLDWRGNAPGDLPRGSGARGRHGRTALPSPTGTATSSTSLPAWLRREEAADEKQEASERDSLAALLARVDGHLLSREQHREQARLWVAEQVRSAPPAPDASAAAGPTASFVTPRCPPLSIGGAQLPTGLQWVLEAHPSHRASFHDQMTGTGEQTIPDCPLPRAEPVVYFADVNELRQAAQSSTGAPALYHEVPASFAARYRRLNAATRHRLWCQFFKAHLHDSSRENRVLAAAQTLPRSQRDLQAQEDRSTSETTTPDRSAPAALFFWRLSGEKSENGDGEEGCATLQLMVPRQTVPDRPLASDTGLLSPLPRSPFWLPSRLLAYLPHFPLPSSLALHAISAPDPLHRRGAQTSGSASLLRGVGPVSSTFSAREWNITQRARAVERALTEATAGLLRTSPSLPVQQQRQSPDTRAAAATPQVGSDTSFAGATGAFDGGLLMPETIRNVLLSRWSRFWARCADPTAALLKPYFFPYQAFSYLEGRSRERLRTSSAASHSRQTAHLSDADGGQRAEARRRPRREFTPQGRCRGSVGGGATPSCPSPVLTWKHKASYVGDAYLNAADTAFGSFVDAQLCVRHAIPLDECGNIFYDAIPAARQQSQLNLRDGSRLMRFIWDHLRQRTAATVSAPTTSTLPSLFGDDAEATWHLPRPDSRRGSETAASDPLLAEILHDVDASDGAIMAAMRHADDMTQRPAAEARPRRSQARRSGGNDISFHMTMRRAQRLVRVAKGTASGGAMGHNAPSLHAPTAPEARCTALAPTDEEAAHESPPPAESPWLARLRREDAFRVSRVMTRTANPAERLSVMKGVREEAQFAFLSPYWIDVGTMEERWGLVPVRGVSPICVNGRTFVNAEQTLDASRFNAFTCTPKRIHEVLCREGLLTCTWDYSAHLRRKVLHQQPQPQQSNRGRRGSRCEEEAADAARPLLARQAAAATRGSNARGGRSFARGDSKAGKSAEDVDAEASEIWRTENLWVAVDLVELAGWRLTEPALVVSIPVGEFAGASPQVRGSREASSSSALAASSGQTSYTCVYAPHIMERHELVFALAYKPLVLYGKVDPAVAPGDDGYDDWQCAQELARTRADAGAQRVADRVRNEIHQAKKAKQRRRWTLPPPARLELAFLALRSKDRTVRRTPPENASVAAADDEEADGTAIGLDAGGVTGEPGDLWVTTDFLHEEPAVYPLRDRESIAAAQVDVMDLSSPDSSSPGRAVRGDSPMASPASLCGDTTRGTVTLTLVHRAKLQWPSPAVEAAERVNWLVTTL